MQRALLEQDPQEKHSHRRHPEFVTTIIEVRSTSPGNMIIISIIAIITTIIKILLRPEGPMPLEALVGKARSLGPRGEEKQEEKEAEEKEEGGEHGQTTNNQKQVT